MIKGVLMRIGLAFYQFGFGLWQIIYLSFYPRLWFTESVIGMLRMFAPVKKWQRQAARQYHLDEASLLYGEIAYSSLLKAFKCIPLDNLENPIVVDLGCGFGKPLFYLAKKYENIQFWGIECVVEYTYIGARLANKIGLKNIFFTSGDLNNTQLAGDVFFVWGTTIPEEALKMLAQKLFQLPSNVYVFSASAPLPDMRFQVIQTFSVWFSWGKGTLYLQTKNPERYTID